METKNGQPYEALALRWRPQTFADVLAQQQVTQTLTNAVAGGRIHHAYLFCGPRGTGKTTTARILAKALNCEKGPTPTPCNECPSCVSITRGSSIDVLEIDAASNTGVDDVRELRESSRYVPAGSRYKIYIIDEVHRLSKSAFDALLKTLEEPPDTVKFIFATTEPHDVPATVRSRALRFDFHLIPHAVLRAHLLRMAESEGIAIDAESADILAAEAAGSVRDAQSLLDQIASYAAGPITAAVTTEALGLVDAGALFRFSGAVAESDPGAALEVIGDVGRAGRSLVQFMQQLSEHWKRLLFARALGDAFVDEALSEDGRARYREDARRFAENDLVRLLLMTIEVGNRIRKSAQPRLEMEMFAMRAARIDRAIDIRALVDRLEEKMGGGDLFGKGSNPVTTAPPSVTNPRNDEPASRANPSGMPPAGKAMPQPPSSSPGAPVSSQAVATATIPSRSASAPTNGRIDFEPILDAICSERATLRAILGSAVLTRSGPGTVELDVYNGSTFHSRQLAQKPIRDLIHSAITKAVGAGVRIAIHVKDGPPPESRPGSAAAGGAAAPARTAPAPDNGETVRADHHVQEILRRFDGEIVS